MATNNWELFTEKVGTGARIYFFDVKEDNRGHRYLVINETKKIGDKWERSRVIVDESNIFSFNEHLKKAIQFLMDLTVSQSEKMSN